MIIQKRLGIGQDCLAFDVNLGCTGYVSGLQILAALLQNTGGKGLLLAGDGRYDKMSEVPTTDSLLFGDGGSATAIELEDGNPMMYAQKTDGTRHGLLSMALDGRMTMNGNAILLFSLNEVCQSIKECRKHFEVSEDSIDYYILHQAQKLILDGIARECGIEPSKVLTSYEEFGNTSTATLPLTICNNVEEIKKKNYNVKVLILTVHNELEYLLKAIDIGVDGYILKDSESAELKKAIQAVLSGENYIQASLIPALNNRLANRDIDKDKIDSLTTRELEVLIKVANGMLNKEIATSLNISERTVKNHISNIFKKIDVSDRTQAAVFAIKNNIITLF